MAATPASSANGAEGGAEGDRRRLRRPLHESGMATALSIDHWHAPESIKCRHEAAPDLSVNFLCMHPSQPRPQPQPQPQQPHSLPQQPPSTSTSTSTSPPHKPTAARFQEIFVDLVGMHCASLDAASRHVLDDRFDSFLGKGEREFKDAVMRLMSGAGGSGGLLTDDARNTEAYRVLEGALRSKMGYRNTYFWSCRKNYRRDEVSGESGHFMERLERGTTRLLSGIMPAYGDAGAINGDDDSEEQFRDDGVRRTLDKIRADLDLCRCLAFCGRDASEEKLREALRQHLAGEELDLLLDVFRHSSPEDESKLFRSLLRPPSHVFVCNASVCDLHCDAFLCPGAIARTSDCINGSIPRQWRNHTLRANPVLEGHVWPYDFKRYDHHRRVVTHRRWPWDEFRSGRMAPVPFVVMGEVSLERSRPSPPGAGKSPSSGGGGRRLPNLPAKETHVGALMETVTQFLSVAASELRANQPAPLAGRERYLLAVPVLGTGGGFAGDLTGEVVEGLLHLLSRLVSSEDDVDVVLVCADEATHAHAQSVRSDLMRSGFDERLRAEQTDQGGSGADPSSPPTSSSSLCLSFQYLTEEMRDSAMQLAELASSGHLSLFLGAGVSIGSGLPGWFSLLHAVEDLFTPTGVPGERKLGEATRWDPLLMADLLDGMCASRPDRHGIKSTLKHRVCDYIERYAQHPGLLLSLLLSLPCQSVVTQNYDRLIERAFECWSAADPHHSSRPLSVIPYGPRRNAHHWLLKMHGCVRAPDEIVITGGDYARFDASRYRALGGLVQASLLTKHLLFVGFSMTDPNYLTIIDQVRSALHGSNGAVDVLTPPRPVTRLGTI